MPQIPRTVVCPAARRARRTWRWPCVTLLLACAACRGAPDDIVIGYAFPPTGLPSVLVAQDELDSLAVRDGVHIRIVYDSVVTGDPADVEVARARRLVETPFVVAVVGHGGSRASLAAAPVYNNAKVANVIPTGTSRLLRELGRWSFVLADDDSVEGAMIAQFARRRFGARRVTIFYTNDEYGIGLRDGVLESLGGDVEVLDQVLVTPQVDFEPLVDAALLRGTPDVAIVAARCVETGRIARLLHARAPRVGLVVGDGSLLFPCLTGEAGPAADSMYAVTFWLPDRADSLSRAFVERFRRVVGGEPSPSQAMSHAALMVVARAIREVGPSPTAIRDYLASLGRSRPAVPTVVGDVSFAPGKASRLVVGRVRGTSLVRVGVP